MAEYVNGKNIQTPKNKFSYKQPDYNPELGFMGLKKLFAGLNKPGQEGFDPTKGLFGLALNEEQQERRAGWRKNREERRKAREARRSGIPLEKTDEDLDDEDTDEPGIFDWDYWFPEGEEGTVDIDTSVGDADLGLLTNEFKGGEDIKPSDYAKEWGHAGLRIPQHFVYDKLGDDADWWDLIAPYEGSIKEDIHRNPKDYVGSPFITSRRGKVF